MNRSGIKLQFVLIYFFFRQTSLLRGLRLLLLLLTPPCIRRIPVHIFPHFALFIPPLFVSAPSCASCQSRQSAERRVRLSLSLLWGGSGTIFSGIIMRALVIGGEMEPLGVAVKKEAC